MGAPRVPPLNPSESIVLWGLACTSGCCKQLHGKLCRVQRPLEEVFQPSLCCRNKSSKVVPIFAWNLPKLFQSSHASFPAQSSQVVVRVWVTHAWANYVNLSCDLHYLAKQSSWVFRMVMLFISETSYEFFISLITLCYVNVILYSYEKKLD